MTLEAVGQWERDGQRLAVAVGLDFHSGAAGAPGALGDVK